MESEFCKWFAGVEETFWRMTRGVIHFAFVHVPQSTCRALVDVVGPAVVRMARAGLALALWLAVLLLPCLLFARIGGLFGWTTAVLWLALGIGGSSWGLSRVVRWREITWWRGEAA